MKISAKRYYTLDNSLANETKMSRKNLEQMNLLEALMVSCQFTSRTNMLVYKP